MWPGHGPINLRRALAVSCNPYFEWVGEQLGYEKVQHYAHLLGLGERSGINLAGETTGVVPGSVQPWAVGHLSSHAAGIQTSAVQLGVLLSACINGGVVFQPQVGAASGFEAKERWRLPATSRLDALKEGFIGAVNEGSAMPAFDPEVVVAGKTGSCSSLGWFASYAPAERAELVVVVFLRQGSGHGASAVAGRIYPQLFKPVAAPAVASGRVARGRGRRERLRPLEGDGQRLHPPRFDHDPAVHGAVARAHDLDAVGSGGELDLARLPRAAEEAAVHVDRGVIGGHGQGQEPGADARVGPRRGAGHRTLVAVFVAPRRLGRGRRLGFAGGILVTTSGDRRSS